MSSNELSVQADAHARRRRVVVALAVAVLVETGLVLGHFAHGARVYEDPARLHVVTPATVFAVLALLLCGAYLWRPSPLTRRLLGGQVAFVYVAVFGGYHGAFSHAAKDLLFLAGVGPERLESIFDSPDFALPNDVMFEVTGLATLGGAVVVLWLLIRLFRLPDTASRASLR